MYTSVNVLPQLNPIDLAFPKGKLQPNVTNATAEVVNGAQFVLVSVAHGGNVATPPVAGNPYRIVGAGGLNLVGVYLGHPEGSSPQPMRFKVGD